MDAAKVISQLLKLVQVCCELLNVIDLTGKECGNSWRSLGLLEFINSDLKKPRLSLHVRSEGHCLLRR